MVVPGAPKFSLPYKVLFVAKGDDRIDAGGAAGRQVSRGQSCEEQQRDRGGQAERIVPFNP